MSDDDRTVRSLRDAASPGLAEGAAERIAAGAWERAARMRATRRPRILVLRRASWAVAAAFLVGATLLLWRGTDPAFAVEGDPVMVQRGARWVETHDVQAGVVVHVPDGERRLLTKAGDVFRPRPGSVFRCDVEEERGAVPILRVEFSEGGGDVDGASVVVSMRDEVVVERDPKAAMLCLSFAFDGAGGSPRVRVKSGSAVASSPESGERMLLGAKEQAAFLSISVSGGTQRRFARVADWSAVAAEEIAKGRVSVVDADFDAFGGVLLVGGDQGSGVLAFDVPSDAIRDALRCVNGAAVLRALVDVRVSAKPSRDWARYIYEKDATRVVVEVDACGAVHVDDGDSVSVLPSLAAFRRQSPELASLFGDALSR